MRLPMYPYLNEKDQLLFVNTLRIALDRIENTTITN